jgi:hypothetical protein
VKAPPVGSKVDVRCEVSSPGGDAPVLMWLPATVGYHEGHQFGVELAGYTAVVSVLDEGELWRWPVNVKAGGSSEPGGGR